jgi:hypothetical protein
MPLQRGDHVATAMLTTVRLSSVMKNPDNTTGPRHLAGDGPRPVRAGCGPTAAGLHEFDLETLRELFRTGDPLVAQDPSDGYYLESSALQDSNGQLDHSAAEPLVKRINGVARATDQGFRPVHLRGRYSAPDGTMSVVAFADVGRVRRSGPPPWWW